MRIFDNLNLIPQDILQRRISRTDPNAFVLVYSSDIMDANHQIIGARSYVGVDSVLTDAQITTGLAPPPPPGICCRNCYKSEKAKCHH